MGNKRMIKVVFGVAVAALTLVGCGDDSSSSPSGKTAEYVTLEEAGACVPSRYGETVFVTSEGEFYFCGGKKWTVIDDGEDGGSSASGGKRGDSSSSADDELDPSAFDTIPIVAVTNKTITGVSQKGPFVNGSSVMVQELDGKTLAQTGKSFRGRIANDKGEFSVSSVSLASQYALLEATGYYWNENTGSKSNGTVTLNALVDLSKRETVNINLLTHLEYERTLHLTSTGMNVPAAKRQAEREILRAFGITGNFASSEELNVLSVGEGNAALLAMSALMQGNLAEAGLSERLANFASDIEQDGTWDDTATKAAIADWASTANLAAIRSHIDGWGVGNQAPAFESTFKAFWWNLYGLGACDAANDGEIKQGTNSLSANHDAYYVCDNGDWRKATVREYDTYRWNAEADGNVKKGLITAAFYKYDSLQTQWIAANARDTAIGLNGCTQKREGEIGIGHDGVYYVCRSGRWQNATVLEYDTYRWSAQADGNVKKGLITAAFYKYDSLQAQWIAANARDTALGLNGCTGKRAGEAGIGDDGGYYICRNGWWQDATGLEYVRSAKTCSHNAELIAGSTTDANRYVCDADAFRVATASEKGMNRGCTSYNLKEEKLFAGYIVCSSSGKWEVSTHTVAGTMIYSGQTYKTIGIGTQMWMAENLNYEYKVSGSIYGNWCYNNSADSCAKYGRLYSWGAAMDSATTGCGYGTDCAASSDKVQGVCPTGWHLPSRAEWSTLFAAVGGADSAGAKLKSTTGWYLNGNGTDSYGFSALPSGDRYYDGNFGAVGDFAYFWSSSAVGQRSAYYTTLYYPSVTASQSSYSKDVGFAVRCVKD